mmetsp:Transcript_60593/g.126858  ORF Transcript_60593/g.126858 Transcript_60593/m.126858 type:complete len:266 (+) Transcript_60593:790-1587(+)
MADLATCTKRRVLARIKPRTARITCESDTLRSNVIIPGVARTIHCVSNRSSQAWSVHGRVIIAHIAPRTTHPGVWAVVTSVARAPHRIEGASLRALSSWYNRCERSTLEAFIALTLQTRARVVVVARAHHRVCRASRHTQGIVHGARVALLALITHKAIAIESSNTRAFRRVRHAAADAFGFSRRIRVADLADCTRCARPIVSRITGAGHCVGSASRQTRTACCSLSVTGFAGRAYQSVAVEIFVATTSHGVFHTTDSAGSSRIE